MSEPITIESVSDFGAVLRAARGRRSQDIIAAAAGCDARTMRRHEVGDACNPRTLIDLLGAAGYRMEVRLVPADTAGAIRAAALTPPANTAYSRAIAYVSAHPGTGSAEVAAALWIDRMYARRILRQCIRAGEVWVMAGRHQSEPLTYWPAE